MTERLIVLAVAVAAVLALVWFRNRRTGRNRSAVSTDPGRGVIGEVATAYEDVGRQFFNENRDQPRRPEAASDVGEKD